jgi:hypothetical protein
MSEEIERRIDKEIREDSVKASSIYGKILQKCDSRQIKRVREILASKCGAYGWSSAQDMLYDALDHFDNRHYSSQLIARFLSDRDLEIALSHKEFRIGMYGNIKIGPKQKLWDAIAGRWYYE